ncbi:TPA: hypothetical protein DCZ39_00830 [Patescibacteria group bacterium]|nr:hypothetical protein [Candidatus Gracilibacteria bacterium]
MKRFIGILVCVLGITNISLGQTEHKIIDSKLELLITAVTELKDSNVHWEKYGVDSKTCLLEMNNQKYIAIRVGKSDCLNKGIYGKEENYGMIFGVNALVMNETKKKEATTDEIVELINWQKAKGFYWNEKEKINKVPRSYDFTCTNVYDVKLKTSFDSSLIEIMNILNGRENNSTKTPMRYSSKNFRSDIIYQSKDAIDYAYSIQDKSVLFFIQNRSSKEIMLNFYKGTCDREYTGLKISPSKARLVVINVPEAKITNTELIIKVTQEGVDVTHIGEKIKE